MRVRFRYQQYMGGPDPLAEPDPPPEEAVLAARALITLIETADPEGEDDRAALTTWEKALNRYADGDRVAVGEVDPRLLARLLGREGSAALRRWEEADHGLSPRELRRLGEVALRDVEAAARGRLRGDHRGTDHAGGEVGGDRPPFRAGSNQVLDAVATVRAAALRRARSEGRDTALEPQDLRAVGVEPSGAAAVALLVDLSHSMTTQGLHEAATRTALALHTLARTRHPEDRLQLVGFEEVAQEMSPGALVAHEWKRTPGTNLHHALRLARAHLRRHPDLSRRILIITDGEPTAHLGEDGDPRFAWPAGPRTVELTVAELDSALRDGAEVTFFLLSDDPRLADFRFLVERRRGVRTVRADAEALGPLLLERFGQGRV